MTKHTFWKWDACRHEHSWPVYTMETNNIFSNYVHVCRPIATAVFLVLVPQIIHTRQVVVKGVKPYIHHMVLRTFVLWVLWTRYTPLTNSSRNAQIMQWLTLNKTKNLLLARSWLDKSRVVFLDKLDKTVLVLAHTEEITLLGFFLELSTMLIFVPTCFGFFISNILLLVYIIPPNIIFQINISICLDTLPKFSSKIPMVRHGCSDIKIVANIQLLIQGLKPICILCRDFHWCQVL
mmetsp:Transcript_819/g.1313  ORF Transcript_819/g.1313 Transcript_819/m.1313 type:complete len:236 (-) Transcript_819:189-896(-)